ncbi:replication initiator protein [Klebsiella pneumoniae subsp. pneumoniae]|nr:replication initiator protein [Klebsiella pneumoniae subsp. pneumoniae]
MGSCAAPSAKGDDKFITTDYLQQCRHVPLPVRRTGGTACRYQSATSQRPDG